MKTKGEKHPKTLMIMNELVNCYLAVGMTSEALEIREGFIDYAQKQHEKRVTPN